MAEAVLSVAQIDRLLGLRVVFHISVAGRVPLPYIRLQTFFFLDKLGKSIEIGKEDCDQNKLSRDGLAAHTLTLLGIHFYLPEEFFSKHFEYCIIQRR